ncbi:hypothetical protein [Fructobacillus cardui]|uniref:hypothetical protein n=1 Tax=Fructobacillus cardui TaxID=2893170 RepID=UPI00200ADD63|nr:hypothetical protein [Fructobacillus cardui]MCK8627042.1 hypothetical protein [Fructobacillus cardui]
MTKAIRIQHIDDNDYAALKLLSEEQGFETVTAFMRYVINLLTHEMDLPQNNVSKLLESMKTNKNEILESTSLIQATLTKQVELLNQILEDNYE